MKDFYMEFLKRFNISDDEFFEFGIEQIIFPDIDKVSENWSQLKKRIENDELVYIRGYGREGRKTHKFTELYEMLFNKYNVKKDSSNNYKPQQLIKKLTGIKRNEDISNFQVSHIFGRTKNIFMFECPWNIAYIPKL